MIRAFTEKDVETLLEIYNYYVLHTTANFDIEILSLEAFKAKITRINTEYPIIIYEEHDEILGFAYGSRFRPKPAYNNTVETTVYVRHTAFGKGIGKMLYTRLLNILKEKGYRVAIGIITIPNETSIKLHEKLGFKKVGELKDVGFKFNAWQTIGIWQLRF